MTDASERRVTRASTLRRKHVAGHSSGAAQHRSKHPLPYVLGCSPILYNLIQPSRNDDLALAARRAAGGPSVRGPSSLSSKVEVDSDDEKQPPLRPASKRRANAKQGNVNVDADTDVDAVLPAQRSVGATRATGNLTSTISKSHSTRPLPALTLKQSRWFLDQDLFAGKHTCDSVFCTACKKVITLGHNQAYMLRY